MKHTSLEVACASQVNHRPTIGLLVDWLETEYQDNVLAGAEETARKEGVNLLCFAGGVLGSPLRFAARRNYVYELAGPHNLDGVVVMAGTLGNYVGLAQVAQFLECYRPLPMVSVGAQLPTMPSIEVDNARGMHALVTHLMHVHGYRRVAFIRGPEASPEAESRFAAYREVLAEYGLPLDPNLVVDGDFQEESGAAAIHTLMQERRVSFEAVVAASDAMAIGAMDALLSRGVRVPYDVAVVGFDDIQSARFTTAPLTTVRQPLYDEGVLAVQVLLAQMRNESVQQHAVLRTQLVTRQSCGCVPQTSLPLAQFQSLPAAESLVRTLQVHRQRLVSDMAQAMRTMAGSLEPAWGERLLDALGAELGGQHRGVFLSTFEEVMTVMATLGGNVSSWHGAIAVLRYHARACREVDTDTWSAAEELWHEARVLVGFVAERAQGQHRLVTERFDRILRGAAEELSTSLEPRAMAPILAARLPQLRIKSHFVALFDGAQGQEVQARIVAAHDAGGRPLFVADHPFPATRLVPDRSVLPERRFTFVVEPIYFEREALGYALFEMGPSEGVIYETLRDHLGSAVMSALLYQRARAGEVGAHSEAVRLQTRLMPRETSVPALRLAAAMLPNGSAGGDYYDFLPTADGCWIALGDLSPGRAPSGVLRAILHGAAAAALAAQRDASPAELLRVINLVFHENIRVRLGTDQDAALLLLRYDRQGRLVFAGAHQDILVYRQATEELVHLSAVGSRIGRVRDIDDRLQDTMSQLHEGDLMVLFTSGVVGVRDGRGELFGVERLGRELERVRFEPVEHIRDHLLAVVRGWAAEVHHDLTIVVGRYGTQDETRWLDEATSPGSVE